MNAYINLYTGSPTDGGTDGTIVSSDAATPLTVRLDATSNESKTVTLAIRCESGYQTSGTTVISFDGTNKAKWQVCKTSDGTFTDTLTISDAIKQANVLFYAKASSSEDEDPSNDASVSIKGTTKIEAAE